MPTGEYLNQLEAVFGKGSVTSGYRTQKEQDALVARGATRAKRSSHTYRNGYDLRANVAASEAELRAKFNEAGIPVGKIIYESGKGRNQGTGPHWHTEIGDVANPAQTYNAETSGNGVADYNQVLRGLESALSPEKKTGGSTPVVADRVMNAGPEIKKREAAVESSNQALGQSIDVLDQVTQAAQAVTRTAMEQEINDTRVISNEIQAGADEVMRQSLPIFQQREEIRQKRTKLAGMNPLVRGIKGIFDLNYDEDYLAAREAEFDSILKSRASDFDYVQNLHNIALGEIERRYKMDTGISNLLVTQAREDQELVALRLSQQQGALRGLQGEVQSELTMIQAQRSARTELMSGLDTQTLVDLNAQAENSGGVVTYKGIQLSGRELREMVQGREQQEFQIEAYKMGIASQRMNFAQAAASNIVKSMTRAQLEAAKEHGWVWNGIQLPADEAAAALSAQIASDTQQAETMAATLPGGAALEIASNSTKYAVNFYNRAKSMFGASQMPNAAGIFQDSTAAIQQLIAAVRQGSPPEVITALTERITKNQVRIEKEIDTAILRSVAGDKRSAGYVKSFVTGAQIDEATATEMLTFYALKGAMPRGMSATPAAKQLFAEAIDSVQKHRTNGLSGAKLETAVAADIQRKVGTTLGSATFNDVFADFPSAAAKVGLPIGKLSSESWKNADNLAEIEAAKGLQGELGTSWQNILSMSRSGKPLSSSEHDKELYAKFEAVGDKRNSLYYSALLQNINDLPQVEPGTDNSDLLISALQSSKMQQAFRTYESAINSNSMGDYIFQPLSRGGLSMEVARTSRELQTHNNALRQDNLRTARQLQATYASNPNYRMQVILRSIPGVGVTGAKTLGPAIESYIANTPAIKIAGDTVDFTKRTVIPGQKLGTSRGVIMLQEEAVLNYLKSTKFDDPQTDSYRKAAVKGWEQAATETVGWGQTMLDVLQGN